MPKTITRSTGPDGGVIDADTDPDGVSAALGLDDAEPDDDEQDPDEVDETDEGDDDEDDDPIEALRAELREQKRTIARLTREAAAKRVKDKTSQASKGKATDSSDDGETVEQAAERGREEARLELGLERAGDRIRAALTGIIPENDLDDFVDDLRLERYVDEDGKPDGDAIKALKDRQAKITRRKAGGRSVGHARQGGGSTSKSKSEVMGDVLTSLGI